MPNTTYTFCLRAHDEAGEESLPSTPLALTTAAIKPTLEGEETVDETKTSAQLDVKIDPQGSATSYLIEYGESTAYGSTIPVPAASIGEGHSPVLVSQTVTGLDENTEYHWRIGATNAAGTTTSLDQTFVYDTAGEPLPDGRAYEMVTPVHKMAPRSDTFARVRRSLSLKMARG